MLLVIFQFIFNLKGFQAKLLKVARRSLHIGKTLANVLKTF